MGEAMLRTSYSQILNSSRDFSTAICDLDGRLIAQAEHVPIHVGALPFAAKAVTEFFGDDIHQGDVFLLNDPYHGGNHLPDLTAFVPVFQGDRPRFWSINRAHQSDIGGATHGAYNAAATDIWQEGLRITPLRLYDRGEARRDLLEMIATNVRHPRDFRGDLAAMIGSAHVGERRLLALAAEFGWPVTDAASEAVLDGAEPHPRAVIEAIIKALALATPDRAMAGWGRRFRIAIQGTDPRSRKPFIWHFFQARPGGGASPAGDGWPGAGEWQAAGGIKFGSLEVTEVRFPLFFRRHEFRPDSGGAGEYRGGPGGVVEMVVEAAEPAGGNAAGDGVRYGACGILGGTDGVPHRYTVHSDGRPPRPIRTKEVGLVIRANDVLVL